jgi:hypothetical protein
MSATDAGFLHRTARTRSSTSARSPRRADREKLGRGIEDAFAALGGTRADVAGPG